MADSIESLHKHLEQLPNRDGTVGGNFNQAIPGFIENLGYDEDNLYFDVTYEPTNDHIPHLKRVDAAIKDDVTSPIWMTISTDYADPEFIETWPGHRGEFLSWDREGLKEIHEQTNAHYAVALSNFRIAWYDGYNIKGFPLQNISEEDTQTLFEDLSAPSTLPEDHEDSRIEEIKRFHRTHLRDHSDVVDIAINTDYYYINLQEFWDLLEEMREAEEPSEKGDALENLSRILFDGFPFIGIREHNMRTSSGEIDIILEYQQPSQDTFFDDYGRYTLVECKNWKKAVGSDVVRDFTGKMDSAKVDLGIIVASNGITGRSGKDAVDELNQYYQREGSVVVVIDESDLETIIQGNSLYEILDEKIFNRRFRKFV